MTLRVTIADDHRQVTVEDDGGAPVAALVADALTRWHERRPQPRLVQWPEPEPGGVR